MSENKLSSLKPEPLQRKGLAEKVLARILGLVRTGNLKAGDKLPSERDLMKIFDVSRPPIREALSALNVLGVVDSRHGGGAVITDLDAQRLLGPLDFYLSISNHNVSDMFYCRRLVEVEAAGRAAHSLDTKGKDELTKLIESQDLNIDTISPCPFEKAFHEKVSMLAGSEMLSRLTGSFYNLGLESRQHITHNTLNRQNSLRERKAISVAISDGDSILAKAEMETHLLSIERLLAEDSE